MKTAVVYYTRFGHNVKVAEAMAGELGAELFQIRTKREYSYMQMGFHSTFNLDMKLEPMELDFTRFDLLVVSSPVWAWKPASPTRTFLKAAKLPSRLAVCLTTKGGPTMRAQEKLKQLLAGRGVEITAFGEIDTEAEDDEYLRREAVEFARRVNA